MSESEKKPEQVFVIQQQQELLLQTVGEEGARTAWVDIATVTIPANTPRRISLKQALEEGKVRTGESAPLLRALDAKSAEVHEPEAHQPPMEWRL